MITPSTGSRRYYALDSVRATAMLLGVVYHALIFRMFVGGSPPGPMAMGGAARYVQDWLHSFRMPLFFLISGFFGRMMLQKYGLGLYLRKRWARIGVPMIVGMFTFGPAYVLTREAVSSGPGFGGGPPGMAVFGPGGGGMPPPPPGFVPPPLARFDTDNDGSLSGDEWKVARAELEKADGANGPRPGPPPGFSSGGPPPSFGPGGPGLRPGGPFGQGGGFSFLIFGPWSRLFQLNHLWFLWYLLIFVTVAPLVASVLSWIAPRHLSPELGDRLIQSGLAPIALGLISAPALLLVSGMFGWYLGLAGAIFRAFPDFLLHLDPDMAFFFMFFLAGWWLHRQRDAVPRLARGWVLNLVLGLVAFGVAIWLSDSYNGRVDVPNYRLIRWAGYALYSVSSAAMSLAFIGFFQKYLDRPSPAGRYLADTALWVYLIHQPFVIVGLAWFVPYQWPWWVQTSAVFLFAVAASLLIYEAMVRPTFLVAWFGPAGGHMAGAPSKSPVIRPFDSRLAVGSSSDGSYA